MDYVGETSLVTQVLNSLSQLGERDETEGGGGGIQSMGRTQPTMAGFEGGGRKP